MYMLALILFKHSNFLAKFNLQIIIHCLFSFLFMLIMCIVINVDVQKVSYLHNYLCIHLNVVIQLFIKIILILLFIGYLFCHLCPYIVMISVDVQKVSYILILCIL